MRTAAPGGRCGIETMRVPTPIRLLTVALVILAAGGGAAWVAQQWRESRLPDTYSVMDYGRADYGGGPAVAHGEGQGSVSVSTLTGPTNERPDVRFTLTAATRTISLPSGKRVDALTFGGRVPGPELRARQGDLVQVTVRNRDVAQGVSIHWHGVDVPNAEDGVAGVTQNAVPPGGRHIYRFRAEQLGTFWYHTHQSSAREVRRGLFGAFVIEPRDPPPPRMLDLAVLTHRFGGTMTLSGRDGVWRQAATAGTDVRLRLVNTDSSPERILVGGVPFRVLAIDGTDLNRPAPLVGRSLELAAGGRYDIGFTMPPSAVSVAVARAGARLVLSPGGRSAGREPREGAAFDPTAYGEPAATPFGPDSRFDRDFRFEIGRKLGFLDGRPGLQWAVNGGIYPDVPTFVVSRGDLVRMTIVNRTDAAHPMHLHGHHVLVLSRNGRPVSGSPWWSDTLNVGPDERYVVALRAANPGIWMLHCHNLGHAADGLTTHLAYTGVTTPFTIGGRAGNRPE